LKEVEWSGGYSLAGTADTGSKVNTPINTNTITNENLDRALTDCKIEQRIAFHCLKRFKVVKRFKHKNPTRKLGYSHIGLNWRSMSDLKIDIYYKTSFFDACFFTTSQSV
jgi:hypothetical protein